MIVHPWEYWSVAQMLIATHGVDAETVVSKHLDDAEANGCANDAIVWGEIRKKLASIRSSAAPLDPQP